MSFRGSKSLLLVLPIFLSLLACSGAGGGGAADGAEVAKLQDSDRRVSDWAAFVGLEPGEAQQALETAGLLDQVGKNAPLNEAQAQAFFELAEARDSTFSQGIQDLSQRNQKAFLSFSAALRVTGFFPTAQPSQSSANNGKNLAFPAVVGGLKENSEAPNPFGRPELDIGAEFSRVQGLRQTSLDDYVAMKAQAFVLRGRLLQAAEILGLGLAPATMKEIVDDPAFAEIRDAYASPLVLAIFAKKISKIANPLLDKDLGGGASLEEINFAAEGLANVSFKVGARFVSFFEFNGVILNPSQGGGILALSPTAGKNEAVAPVAGGRGIFKVLGAEDNFFQNQDLNPELEKSEIEQKE